MIALAGARRPSTLCATAGLLAVLVLAVAQRPANANMLEISGPARFVVTQDCTKALFALTFTVEAAEPLKPVMVRTKDPLPAVGAAAIPWTLDWQPPALSEASVAGKKEYRTTGAVKNGCPDVGTFSVPVTITFSNGSTEALAPLTLESVADPVLETSTPVTLPVMIWPLPAGWASAPVVPALAVREASTRASIPNISTIGSSLKNAVGEQAGIELVPDGKPLRLEAGQGGRVALALSGPPDAGTYTSRLVLRAKGLADKPVEVTLKVRVYTCFLLLTIAIGIALGWLLNMRLAKHAAIDAARLAALRAAGAIAARATSQKDPVVQQRLLGVAQALDAQLHTDAAADAVQAHVTAAQQSADAIETQATTTATSFAQATARVQASFQPGGNPLDEVIRAVLAPLIGELADITRAGSAGDATQATQRLSDFEQSLTPKALAALRPWLNTTLAALDEIGPWAAPAQDLETARESLINTKILPAFASVNAGTAIQACDAAARELRIWACVQAPRTIPMVFRAAAEVLRSATNAGLATSFDGFAEAARTVGGNDPSPTLAALSLIRRHAETALRQAVPPAPNLVAALASGDFVAVARMVATPPTPGVAMAPAPAAAALDPVLRARTATNAAALPAIPPRLIVSASIRPGVDTSVQIDWAGSAPAAALTWSCDPAGAATFRDQSANGAHLCARHAGLITIVATDPAGRAISARTYVGEPTATTDYVQIANDAGRVEFWTALAAAAITGFAGYTIFSGTWFGTPSDFFSVFVWGFFGQFGLDRIRTLTQSIVTRALPA